MKDRLKAIGIVIGFLPIILLMPIILLLAGSSIKTAFQA